LTEILERHRELDPDDLSVLLKIEVEVHDESMSKYIKTIRDSCKGNNKTRPSEALQKGGIRG
jgi:hypothetical protein